MVFLLSPRLYGFPMVFLGYHNFPIHRMWTTGNSTSLKSERPGAARAGYLSSSLRSKGINQVGGHPLLLIYHAFLTHFRTPSLMGSRSELLRVSQPFLLPRIDISIVKDLHLCHLDSRWTRSVCTTWKGAAFAGWTIGAADGGNQSTSGCSFRFFFGDVHLGSSIILHYETHHPQQRFVIRTRNGQWMIRSPNGQTPRGDFKGTSWQARPGWKNPDKSSDVTSLQCGYNDLKSQHHRNDAECYYKVVPHSLAKLLGL